jgi:Phytanoyl-CoA dioxygenase (PhyH)
MIPLPYRVTDLRVAWRDHLIHDISWSEHASLSQTYELLKSGKSVVLRQVPEILWLRERLVESLGQRVSPAAAMELRKLFERRQVPSLETIAVYASLVRDLHATRALCALLRDLIARLCLPSPQMWEGGVHRMCLPSHIVQDASARSDLFPADAMLRERPGGAPEIFSQWSPPHRDIGRPHSTFQVNLWFPLTDLDAKEALVLFPDVYRQPVPIRHAAPPWWETRRDLPIEAWGYGKPQQVALAAGDMLIFHGETVHCSPPSLPDSVVRLSIDFRVSCRCRDNNQIYREGFVAPANFADAYGRRIPGFPSARRAANALLSACENQQAGVTALPKVEGGSTAFLFLYRLQNLAKRSDKKALASAGQAVLSAFHRFPFAEDRYIALSELVQELDETLAAEALDLVIDRTESYFWAARAGDVAHRLGLTSFVIPAYEKALALAEARRADRSPSDNPFDYADAPAGSVYAGRLQPYPHEFADVLRHTLDRYRRGDIPEPRDTFLHRLLPWANAL